MKCDDARAAFLTGYPSRRHLNHLSTCSACSSIAADLEMTLSALNQDAVWEEPGPSIAERVVTLISGTSGDAPQSGTRTYRWLVAAAVTVALIAVGGALVSSRTAAPDWEITLPGTSNTPLAIGTVRGWNEPNGTRLVLEIDGLEEAPPGSIYKVWFSRQAIHISAGSFTSSGTIDMWTGVSRRDYPRLWITLERVDEDQGPSGRAVLDTG